jgi:hypothetical protein
LTAMPPWGRGWGEVKKRAVQGLVKKQRRSYIEGEEEG